jgi:hypothetical protein
VKRLAIIAALVAALAASRSIAVEPERIMDVATWGAGDWFFAFIVVAWFLGDLTTGRANAVRGVIFAAGAVPCVRFDRPLVLAARDLCRHPACSQLGRGCF